MRNFWFIRTFLNKTKRLFLIKNEDSLTLQYQVFIEPKGSHLIKQDEWKQNFLTQLKNEYQIEKLWKDKNYIVWGMPFFNETDTKLEFEEAFEKLKSLV